MQKKKKKHRIIKNWDQYKQMAHPNVFLENIIIQQANPKQELTLTNSDFIQEKFGKITSEYNLLNPPLGKGAYAEVRKAVHKSSGILRAVKIIKKDKRNSDELKKLINEVDILKKLDHPNIMKIFEFYQDNAYFYIVSELCTGGELFDRITQLGSFSEEQASEIMKQMLKAINYCHANNIVHRDIKPENLLYETEKPDSLIKVIDFGVSTSFDPTKPLSQRLGTPYYIAPEVLRLKYDSKCDIWSCGVVLYILLCGYPPFQGASDEAIMRNVQIGNYTFNSSEWADVSDHAKDLIRKMLTLDPRKRLSAQECLQHSWFQMNITKQIVSSNQMKQCLTNLTKFRGQQRIQEAIYMFIVNYMTTKEEKDELLKIFNELDTNQDGSLSYEELLNGYTKFLSQEDATIEVDKIFQKVDIDKSGKIDYSEFIIASINKQNMLSKQRLEDVFKLIDKDKSGNISFNELRALFGNNKQLNSDFWDKLMGTVDKNGDGEISQVEFKDMMFTLLN